MTTDPHPQATFAGWLKTHRCSTETLWCLQNAFGTLLGFDHPLAVEAKEALIALRPPNVHDFLTTLPLQLRESISGHKGEAFRITSQLCEEFRDSLPHE